jgi:hypothetical protein
MSAREDDQEDYDADIAEFTFILEVLLRQRILVEKSAPSPIEPGIVERMTSSRTDIGVSTPIPVGVSVSYSLPKSERLS